MNIDFNEEVEPLVDETLTTDEVISLIKSGKDDIYNGPVLLNNITYITWDDVSHQGVLVSIKHPDCQESEDYFMERRWVKVKDCGSYWLCKPVFYKLLPLVLHRTNDEDFKTMQYEFNGVGDRWRSLSELIVKSILKKCYFDNIRINGEVKGLEIPDVKNLRGIAKSGQEYAIYRESVDKLIDSFTNEDIPAGDKRWDDLLFGEKYILSRVFDQLRKKGHIIHLDGEKDSFGWVSCGIVMDGKLMTSEYF